MHADTTIHIVKIVEDSIYSQRIDTAVKLLHQLETSLSNPSAFGRYGIPIIIACITASAIIFTNWRLVKNTTRLSTKSNRMTLHLDWVSSLRKNTAIFLKATHQQILDQHKVYLVVFQAENETLRAAMKEGLRISADNVRESLRQISLEQAEAISALRMSIDLNDRKSVEIANIRETMLNIIDRPNRFPENKDGYDNWKNEMIQCYGELAADLVSKTLAYIRDKEKELLNS